MSRATPLHLLPIKVLYVSVREFLAEQGPGRASALAYTSLLSLIPLAVVVLSILGLVQDESLDEAQFIEMLADQMLWPEEPMAIVLEAPAPEAAAELEVEALPRVGELLSEEELARWREHFDERALVVEAQPSRRDELVASLAAFSRNLRSNLKTIGIIGALFLILATVSLFNAIEHTLNRLWHVRTRRNPLKKFLVLWALLTLGPILLFASMVLHARLEEQIDGGLDSLVLPYVFSCTAFFFLYKFVPNCRVRITGALLAAIFSGALWELVKILFNDYVSAVFSSGSRLAITYGSLALIPIFLVWLYISWVVALLGVKLSYAWQHLDTFSGKRWRAEPRTAEALEVLAGRCVAAVVEKQYDNGAGISIVDLSRTLRAPQHRVEEVAEMLRDSGILREDAESGGLFAAMPPDELTLEDVTRAVRGDGQTTSHRVAGDPLGARILELLSEVDERRRAVLGGVTLASLCRPDAPPADGDDDRD